MSKQPRPVRIETAFGVHFVKYTDRKPGQRYLAAQFDARDTTPEAVREWVKRNPKIELQA